MPDYLVMAIGATFVCSILLVVYLARKEIKAMEKNKYKPTKEVKMMNKFRKSCVK